MYARDKYTVNKKKGNRKKLKCLKVMTIFH